MTGEDDPRDQVMLLARCVCATYSPCSTSNSLQQAINRLEDGIVTLSGPALAVSGIIAGVDLLTGGHLLQQTTWLALGWAICLLLTLDFQGLSQDIVSILEPGSYQSLSPKHLARPAARDTSL